MFFIHDYKSGEKLLSSFQKYVSLDCALCIKKNVLSLIFRKFVLGLFLGFNLTRVYYVIYAYLKVYFQII